MKVDQVVAAIAVEIGQAPLLSFLQQKDRLRIREGSVRTRTRRAHDMAEGRRLKCIRPAGIAEAADDAGAVAALHRPV